MTDLPVIEVQPISPSHAGSDQVALAVAKLDAWFETMRCPGGYGGPVAHWWQQSLLYTGPGRDWRYEGIIAGYLALWRKTGNAHWLRKACRAGDDLAAGQTANGHYAASAFELNPASAGTPHEAACDVGLLLLALELKEIAGNWVLPDWQRYAECAERNLRAFYIDQLWDATTRAFRDDPHTPSFVPNKAATACEALFLLAEVQQADVWVNRYALPTLERVLAHQVNGGPLDGAIAQNTLGRKRIEKYFPIYIARCAPALVQGYCWTGDERYAAAAQRLGQFLARVMQADGSFPTVLYANGRSNQFPSWIAPLADILWAGETLGEIEAAPALAPAQERLLAGQDASGGIQTARGFAAQAGGRPGDLPDVRDLLHVAGWCDKAFRYLASICPTDLPDEAAISVFETPCRWQGQRMDYRETESELRITQAGETRYLWRKGTTWAEVAAPSFWLH